MRKGAADLLKSILSPDTCRACKNCCVFEPQSAWELPTFLPESCIRIGLTDGEAACARYRIALRYDETGAARNCPFLDPETGCTLPAEEKPFACSIWPLRVMRMEDGRLVFAVYRGCSGLPEEKFPALEQLLADGLKARIYEEMEKDATLVLPYHPNYHILDVR